MRDGDKNGVWTLIEEGLTYVRFLYLFVHTSIFTCIRFACFFAHVPWLGVYAGKVPVLAEPLRRLHALGGQSVRERMARGSKTCDLYHYLVRLAFFSYPYMVCSSNALQNNEDIPDKEPPPFRHLVDDGILAIVAGTDTTTSAITSLFFLLMTHPDRYAKLQGEIDKYYPRGEDAADTKHHRHMPYLHAVMSVHRPLLNLTLRARLADVHVPYSSAETKHFDYSPSRDFSLQKSPARLEWRVRRIDVSHFGCPWSARAVPPSD